MITIFFYIIEKNLGVLVVYFLIMKLKIREKNFKFIRELGITFIMISKKYYTKKKNFKWSKKDKEKQLYKRGRYAEFNLLYDRGTKFGLNSGGDVIQFLCLCRQKQNGNNMQKEPLTISGLKKLKSELDNLKNIQRPKIVAAIAEARSHGDLKENAEYHAAKEQQSQMEVE